MSAPTPSPGIPFVATNEGYEVTDPDTEFTLRFSRAEFLAFVDGCKRGEFDHLVEPVPHWGACR